MHALALGAKWGARSLIGPVPASARASRPSLANSEASASVPSPLADVARKSRRVICTACSSASWLRVSGFIWTKGIPSRLVANAPEDLECSDGSPHSKALSRQHGPAGLVAFECLHS